jgi:hypothetical protein
MAEETEHVIRSWARSGGPAAAPTPPTDRCLTFAQAEAVARSGEPRDAETADHTSRCPYCRRLVADFREALAEGAAALPATGAAEARRPARTIRLYRWAGVAAAAVVLLAAAVIWMARPPADGPILAAAEVGRRADVEAGVRPKTGAAFTSGQQILFRVELSGDAHVLLMAIDSAGPVTPMPPRPETGELSAAMGEGVVRLGPYRLDETVGQEHWIVVAARHKPDDLATKVSQLQAAYAETGSVEEVARRIRRWPAEARVVSFPHTAPGAR